MHLEQFVVSLLGSMTGVAVVIGFTLAVDAIRSWRRKRAHKKIWGKN